MSELEHPEEALERAISGTLSSEERPLLEQHLASCLACQAHVALASAAKESFEVHPGDSAADRVHVERAMRYIDRPVRARVSPFRKKLLWLAAAALSAMAGLAAAAWVGPPHGAPSVAAKVPGDDSLSPAARKKLDSSKLAETPSESASPLVTPETAAPPASPPGVAPADPVTASALFRKASALRANGESDAAIAVFRKLQKLFPQSRESQLSHVVAGRLLLERGRPAQALDEFDRYLSVSGAASEHALAGRAAALHGLGRSAAEASAWERLLSAYPGSVYDQRAKARLSQLRPAPAGATSAP